MNRLAPLALASLLALALSACGDDASETTAGAAGDDRAAAVVAPADPDDVVAASARHLQEGDLLSVLRLSVPPAEFERMKQRWETEKAKEVPTEEERQQFAEMMQKLTAADAEQALMAEFEPHLQKYDAEMAAQMPLMVGMGRGFVVQSIEQNQELSAEQKQQATQTIDAVVKWLNETNFSDRERARQAVDVAVRTARAVELKTLEELRALNFEQMLEKAGIAFVGFKDLLAVYGLDLDQTFQSVQSEVVSEQGDSAVVKVGYSLFGQPLSFQTEMMKVDGRWYGKDTVEQLTRELDDVEDAAEDATDEAIDNATDGAVDEAPAEAPVEG